MKVEKGKRGDVKRYNNDDEIDDGWGWLNDDGGQQELFESKTLLLGRLASCFMAVLQWIVSEKIHRGKSQKIYVEIFQALFKITMRQFSKAPNKFMETWGRKNPYISFKDTTNAVEAK